MQVNMAKRLLFIDVAKGSAILGVILVHALIVGVWFVPSNALEVLPVWVLGILSPLVIISTWAGFFELMSGLANMYNIYDRLVVREMSFKDASRGSLVNSTGLLLVHYIFIIFFSHRRNAPYPEVGEGEIHTLITGSLELGRFYPTDYQYFYFASVLGSIALAGYFSVITVYIVHKLHGFERINRVILILTGTTITFFIISYPIWSFGYNILTSALQQGGLVAILAIPLGPFTGAFQPFFPIAGFAIIGAIIGLLLSVRNHQEDDPEFYKDSSIIDLHKFINISIITSFITFIVLLVNYITAGNNPLGLFNFYRLPPTLLALNIGLMLLIFKAGIIIFEEPNEEVRQRRAELTTPIRRFGMVTLTVYVLESPVNGFFSFFFHRIVDDPETEVYEPFVSFLPIVLYTVSVLLFWFVAVRLWEKIQFRYSIEYWVIKFGTRFRPDKSSKLDLTKVLYDPLRKKKKEENIKVNPELLTDVD